MKSKDLQVAVKNKCENGDGLAKIYLDMGGVVSKRTINLWIKVIKGIGSINLSYSPGRPCTVRTEANISMAKWRLRQKKSVSTRRLATEMNILRTNAKCILRKDLRLFSYKRIIQLKLTDFQKKKRIKFAKWVLNNYTKEDINRWFFSDKKFFDLDGIYNAQNDRIWAPSREEADEGGAVYEKPDSGESDGMVTSLCSRLYDAGDIRGWNDGCRKIY